MENYRLDSERLIRYFSGSYTEEDTDWVGSVFCDKEKERELRNFMSGQFSKLTSAESGDKKNLDHILYRIHYNINTGEARKRSLRSVRFLRLAFRIAGIIILPLFLYWGLSGYFATKSSRLASVEIKAPAWTRARFSLPDGTTGWLNSNSSVSYNQDFINDRKIILNGEAFFDVYRDKRRPFRVITADVMLKVTGTRFNVASYDDENDVEVVLEEGSLVISDREMSNARSMKPNDLVLYNKDLGEFTTEVVQPQKYLSWKEGKLVFRNDPLDVICRRLGRWYNVDVEVNVASVENLRLRATFVDENLEEVLELLKRSLPIDYVIQNGSLNTDNSFSKKKITILPRNQSIRVKNQKNLPMK
jgi:transmembrane sensor